MSRRRRRKAASFRPSVEMLEDRNLLSTYTVDHLADDLVGDGLSGSLRYCITTATDGDTITFGVSGTINLTGALPDLTHSISIEGPGADVMTVRRDTGGNYRIFRVDSGTTVSIFGLTITNGNSFGLLGGGIYNGGTLTISNSTISGNTASSDNGGFGGGIYNGGTLTLNYATVSGNSAGLYFGEGGGILNDGTLTLNYATVSGNSVEYGGGIYNDGTLALNNSTIASNFTNPDGGGGGGGIFIGTFGRAMTISNSTIAANDGGGIYNGSRHVTMTISNSTIAANDGGGIGNLFGTPLNVRNTIIAANTAPIAPDLFGSLRSLGHNLIGDTQGGSGFDPTDLLNVNPLLGPLQDNGGPTFTMALLPGSPAIDAGDNTDAPDWDQRGEGFPRVVGVIDPDNPAIDIGAFEVQDGGGSPGRSVPRGSKPLPRDVAAQLSPAVSPSRASASSLTAADVPTERVLPDPQAAGVDRLFDSHDQEGAGNAFARPLREQRAELDSLTFDPLRGDELLLA